MRRSLVASALLVCLPAIGLLALPASAQQPNGARPHRSITATGATKPPGAADRQTPGAPFSKASTEADMLKAQRAAAARDKAWDNKMRTTMGSICKGC
ncbi:hypothetical protein [Methylobacterium iners]|jgi:hypothetical protein|uniref:Uncharacterized protein n=1 Tax=Methylobacterium iners TaxID=418707 RepID=A0ABQ4RWE2_9HYPH|nr:hypothetical protein [Methylobacterium iners]GJD94564.1 hypothetical protein OCOJLMKI_1767 [Methylobacterium iners]